MDYQLNNSAPSPTVLSCLATVKLDLKDVANAILCRLCKSAATTSTIAANYSPGPCVLLHCGNKCGNWFLCVNCKKYVDKRRVVSHFESKAHIKAATGFVPNKEETITTAVGVSESSDVAYYCPDNNDDDEDGDEGTNFYLASVTTMMTSQLTRAKCCRWHWRNKMQHQ
jgi:hypothetical protein